MLVSKFLEATMKKMVFTACALMMVLAAGSAMAGANLAWTDCLGSGLGTVDRTVVCANSGTFGNLFISFVLADAAPTVAASDIFTDVQAPTSVTTWWLTSPSSVRWAHASGVSSCPGWFDPAASGPIAFSPVVTQTSASRLRIETTIIVAQGEEPSLDPGTEYLSGQVTLKQNAGGATNTECQAGAAIGIVHLELASPAAPTVVMESPEVTDCVTMRGPGPGKTCPGATPTKKATWGSIKALYR
jgi:hypothetical protein